MRNIICGDANTNIISGGAGDDVIYGIGGANFLYGGLGNDTFIGKLTENDFIDGESGNDKVDYSNLLAANSIRVNLGTTTTRNDEQGISQTVYEISKIGGHSDYVKNISIFEGSAGNDTFTVGAGNYTFIGGAGDDTFNGSNFKDVLIDGGLHINGDYVDYSSVADKIIISLQDGSDPTTVRVSGDTTNHTIKNIENIIGSNTADDTIIGNSSNNTIIGGGGDDTIDGAGGNNYLDGGSHISGDTVSFESVTSVNGISVNIGNSVVTINGTSYLAQSSIRNGLTSTVVNFENIQGSKNADILIGSDEANIINAGLGNDTIYGGKGSNSLNGDAGADKFIMGGFFDGTTTDYAYVNKVDGGSGADILDYSKVTTGAISVTLYGAEFSTVSIYSDNVSIVTGKQIGRAHV